MTQSTEKSGSELVCTASPHLVSAGAVEAM